MARPRARERQAQWRKWFLLELARNNTAKLRNENESDFKQEAEWKFQQKLPANDTGPLISAAFIKCAMREKYCAPKIFACMADCRAKRAFVPNRAISSGPVRSGVGLITRGRLTVNVCQVV